MSASIPGISGSLIITLIILSIERQSLAGALSELTNSADDVKPH